MSELRGRTAVVTGAGRGLGRAYALRLAELGARVAVIDRDLKSYVEWADDRESMTAKSTVDEIVATGGDALGFELDVADAAALDDMAREVDAAWGGIDIAVTNAGGGGGDAESTRASALAPEEFDAVVRHNLHGTMYTVRAVVPAMKRRGRGRIVTVSSIAGAAANPGGSFAHYGSAKAGIAMYTRYLAQELAPHGITCNAVAPGLIATGRVMATVAPSVDVNARIPMGRPGTVDEVTALVEFLVSDRGSYVTGAVIPVDGGMSRGAV